MKEYILFIHAHADDIENLLQDEVYMKKVHQYIYNLASKGYMIDVKPLQMEGVVFTVEKGEIVQGPYNSKLNGIAGYLHLRASGIEELIDLAKEHPLLEAGAGTVEIRPVKITV
jgi:hypothetical protein